MMHSLRMIILGSKHVEVIKKIWCLSGLPVALTSARAASYINIFVIHVHTSLCTHKCVCVRAPVLKFNNFG
jgi:hypothetical protein